MPGGSRDDLPNQPDIPGIRPKHLKKLEQETRTLVQLKRDQKTLKGKVEAQELKIAALLEKCENQAYVCDEFSAPLVDKGRKVAVQWKSDNGMDDGTDAEPKKDA